MSRGGWRTRRPNGASGWFRVPALRVRRERINERRGPGLPNPLAAPEDVVSRPDVRLWVVGAVFLALFMFMGVRLAFLQLVDHAAYAQTVRTNALRTVTIGAPRGKIVDRNGTTLVTNTVYQELTLSRQQASASPGLIGRVAALAGITPQEVQRKLKDPQYDPYQPVPIMTSTPASVILYLEEHPQLFPGVSVQTQTQRAYPNGGAIAPHVLGYVGPITATQYAELKNQGYSQNSIMGKTGIEQFYDSFLRGVDGTKKIEVNAAGVPIGTVSNVPARQGDTVVLNIDTNLQNFVSQSLAQDIYRVRHTLDRRSGRYPPAINGSAIVLDPRNGHVLAMASFPTYTLKDWLGGISKANYLNLLRTGAMNNYATNGLFTPGSTFKLITATAALDDHMIDAGRYVYDSGKFIVPGCRSKVAHSGCVFFDDERSGLGSVNMPLALTQSSDYYFYNLGYLFWAAYSNNANYPYGETAIQDVAAAYGLSMQSGIDLPAESSGRVDSPAVRRSLHAAAPLAFPNASWYTGDNIEMAFGQGSTVVTPLGLANAYATFANGGTRYQPEVAAALIAPNGRRVQVYRPKVAGHVALPPGVRNPILQGLIGAVNDPRGTAYGAFHAWAGYDLATFPVAGKTGTASNAPGQEPNSWFVGFGPAGSPRYVVVCVIGQGGYGANAAAPVVAQTFGYLVHHPPAGLHLPRAPHAPATTTTTRPASPGTTGR